MLAKAARVKLVAFLVVTVLTLSAIVVAYMRVPEQLGLGRYDVSLRLPEASGLYPKALVNYRGVEVGTVEELTVEDTGISVRLSLDDDVRIPSRLRAEVRSSSAIGEQYVNLVPEGSGGPALADGAVIDAKDAELPVSTSDLLADVRALVRSVPKDSLNTTVDELYQAVNGSGDDLGRLLDSASALQYEADANLDPTLALVSDLLPVLQTQSKAREQIRSYTSDLADFTGAVAGRDDEIRALLRKTPGLTKQVNALFDELRPTLPVLLADLATSGKVVETYLPGVEHVLIVWPAVISAAQGVVPPDRLDDPIVTGNLNFKASVNNPPVCVDGFADAKKHRDPQDFSRVAPPTDSYCKIPADDPRIVRGARNLPCPNSARRGATAKACGLVFDRITATGAAAQPRSIAFYDPATGRLRAPDGKSYRLPDLASAQREPATWQQLLTETTRR